MDEATLRSGYGLVTLQIGVNNQYRGRDRRRVSRAVPRVAGARHRAGRRPPARVVVVSIPDWGVTRFAREQDRDPGVIAAALDAFNAIAREQAERAGAQFVDITPISRRHPDLLAEDGLHPSAAQYARWLTAIFPVVHAALY